MESAYLLSEDQAIVELAVDVPFVVRGRQTRVVPAEWAKRIASEFQALGEVAPPDLHPLAPDVDVIKMGEENEFRTSPA
jgi:hypothetical protein